MDRVLDFGEHSLVWTRQERAHRGEHARVRCRLQRLSQCRCHFVRTARRLVPLLDRVLVEKVVPPSVSAGGILLPETTTKVNSGVVVATGPGAKTKDGTLISCDVKSGDTVLLPEYGGTPIKLEGKEFLLYRNDDLLGILQE